MKSYTSKRKLYLLLIILTFIATFTSIIILFINLKVESALTWTSLILIVCYFIFKPLEHYFDYYNNQFLRVKLVENQGNPIKSQKHPHSSDFEDSLKSLGLSLFKSTSDLKIFYHKDKNKKFYEFKKGLLNVVVILYNSDVSYHHKVITNSLVELEDKYKKRNSFLTYRVTIIKPRGNLNDDLIKELSEVYFDRISKMNITSINVLFNTTKKEYLFLYSDSFYPNRYYKTHVDFIKSII